METLQGLEIVRTVPWRVELRADGDGSTTDDGTDPDFLGLDLFGHFATFNDWYEIDSWFEGHFLETTARGTFKKTMKEGKDSIRMLYDHGMDLFIGDKPLSRIDDMHEDDTGPFYSGAMFNTSYNKDLVPGLRAGVFGASHRFVVVKEEWNDEPDPSDHNPKGIPERTIKEARVIEFGPTPFPANPATDAGVRSSARSDTDAYYERLRTRDPQTYELAVARARKTERPIRTNGLKTNADQPTEPVHSAQPEPAPARSLVSSSMSLRDLNDKMSDLDGHLERVERRADRYERGAPNRNDRPA